MTRSPGAVLLRGSGVSATTCAHLLASEGFALAGEHAPARPSVPVVMLSDSALALLRDIFGRDDLFRTGQRIERRIVAWGDRVARTMPHGATVVGGAAMAAEIPAPALSPPGHHAGFTVHSALPSPDAARRRFGHREATAVRVELTRAADPAACHVEATESGWLFLIPHGRRDAMMLAVGGSPDALLGESRLVAAQAERIGAIVARFDTAPRLLETLVGDDWLACGTPAIAFDPICGDGTAQAAREAILAAAVLAGLRDGADPSALLGHYQSMLVAAMRRHLQISLPFYRTGGVSDWWHEQAEAVAQGYAWCTARLADMPEPRFVLCGTRLVPRALAA